MRPTWKSGRLLFGLVFAVSSITFALAETVKPYEKFKETLTIKPLSDGKLLTHLQFSVRLARGKEGTSRTRQFLDLSSYNARELHLTFTQGRWNYEEWGYPVVPSAGTGVELWAWLWKDGKLDANWKSLTNALAGLFCASLNFIDDTVTVRPKLSFRPEGSYNASELFERAELRHGSLPHENVCTENLTPWIKLLPCKATSGIASLLNGHKLYNSNFHSMSIHVRPLCEDPECTNQQLELLQTVSTVVDPVRRSGKRDWSLSEVFGHKLTQACPLAEESKLEVILPGGDVGYKISPDADAITSAIDGDTNERIAVYDLKRVQPGTEISMTWDEEKFDYGYGQERGGIKINIFNKSPNSSIPIIYYDVIPWYLRLYLHTLKVQVNGKDIISDIEHPIKDLFYQPAVDRSRPHVIEAEVSLPPNSLTTLSINFDKVFLKYTEYPPDANRGFDIGSAVVSTISPQMVDDLDYVSARKCIVNNDGGGNNNLSGVVGCLYFPIRIYTETLLVSLPTPDFSMPYNVITLTCTVIALFFGSMFNLMTRNFVALEKDDSANTKKDGPSLPEIYATASSEYWEKMHSKVAFVLLLFTLFSLIHSLPRQPSKETSSDILKGDENLAAPKTEFFPLPDDLGFESPESNGEREEHHVQCEALPSDYESDEVEANRERKGGRDYRDGYRNGYRDDHRHHRNDRTSGHEKVEKVGQLNQRKGS
ncbi:14065_t:CDS:10 [Acaulospora colombiana]|uniref:14065_t:CDS:1 n=1 Tax=Acaulospora colombiana TaxID=27376 RepID=A0ACA9KI56_9GLOM|nr:14065_t:CDS:10 [Acaulospora colombiana]